MARDAALMQHAAVTGESVFSVYSWSAPTLSLGRHQRAAGKYDRERLTSRGITVVRRPTGGRAIMHNREITYSVAAPAAANESLRESYAWINRVLLAALSRIGVNASVAGGASAAALPPGAIPCFARPSEGEIVANGKKLVGSAQWRDGTAFIQHGSILVEDDQTSLAEFVADGAGEDERIAPPPPATLSDLLGRSPDTREFADAVLLTVSDFERADPMTMPEVEIRPAALDRVAAFLDEEWTWRR